MRGGEPDATEPQVGVGHRGVEDARALPVVHEAAGPDAVVAVAGRDGDLAVAPGQQIRADGVAPVAVRPPHQAVGDELVEEVIFAGVEGQAVRVVDPALLGGEVE